MEKYSKFILKESWMTKANSLFSMLWKMLLIFLIISFFIGVPDKDGIDTNFLHDNIFSQTYLDENGLNIDEKENIILSQIALIDIRGLIAEQDFGGLLGPIEQKRSDIIKKLQYIKSNSKIKGVILRINSPGGVVYDSDLIALKVAELKKSGKIVVALFEEQAASGAYYIASQADLIVAHELSITGSLGSIIEMPNANILLDKIGVDFNVIKSGEFKDMGSFYRELSNEEQEVFKQIIDESYNRFLGFIERGRGIEKEELLRIADGRIYTGLQAKELNLVDVLGGFNDAKQEAQKLLDVPEVQVFELTINRNPYKIFFESFGQVSGIFKSNTPSNLIQSLNLQNRLFFL